MLKQDKTDQFFKSAQQLRLKLSGTKEDKEQLEYILSQILCYPNLEDAQKHHRANNLGANDLLSRQKKIEEEVRKKDIKNLAACGCCGALIQNQKLPYCTNLTDLNLGVSVYLFFKNYLFHSLLFLSMFLIYSIYALVTNIIVFNQQNATSAMCLINISTSGCGLSPIGAGSKILNQNDYINYLSQIQSWIGIAFVIFWGILYIYKTHSQLKYVLEMDAKRISAPDFTLMLTHIPRSYLIKPNTKTNIAKSFDQKSEVDNFEENKYDQAQILSDEELQKKFNKQFMDYGRKINSLYSYEVIKINVAKPLYQKTQEDIQNRQKLDKQLHDTLKVFRHFLKQRQISIKFSTSHGKRRQLYQKYAKFYIEWSQKYKSRSANLAKDNVVFVTLRSSDARRQIQNRNRPPRISNFWNLCKDLDFPIKGVKVRKAPHPQQIKWNCVGFPIAKKRLRRFLMWLFTLLLIGTSLGINIGIAFINKDSINIGVSIGISIIVTIINIGIQLVIVHTSYFENQYVASRQQSNIALKIGFAQLINSIGVPIIVTLISQAHTSMQQKSWLKVGGLVDDVFFIGAINVLVPIAYFFDPWDIYLRFWRWWYSRPAKRLHIHGQPAFNKYFGNYNFDMGYQYAYLIKTAIFTSFFVPMQPIIAVFAPIGLVIYYLVTKRNMLNNYQRPNFHFPSINNSVDFILLFSLPAFGLGNLLVNNFVSKQFYYLINGTLITNWIIFGIALGFLVIVPWKIFYCCIQKPQPPQYDYLQKKMLLNTDYDRSNPETKEAAIQQFKDYLDELQKKSELPDQAQMIRLTVFHEKQIQDKSKINNQMLASRLSRLSENKNQNAQPQYNNNLEDYKNIAKTLGQQNENKHQIPNSAQSCNSQDKL